MDTTKEAIRAHALSLGFDTAGFCRPETTPEEQAGLQAFIGGGRHGDMDWMARTVERRADPAVLWPEARTVIVLGMSYALAGDPTNSRSGTGAIAAYARGRDYHDVMKKKLKQLGRWLTEREACEVKVFVDTAPVMEKPLAARAGLGWQGKHTNLVSRTFGSWLLLGEVFTTLELDPDEPETDHCGSCTKCLDACPTDALAEPYRMNAEACISYLTIEHKAEIPERYRGPIGNRVFGCDDCLAVCPWTKFPQPSEETLFQPRSELALPELSKLAGLDDAAFREMFAGTSIKRTGRDRFVRNVAIAAGNSGRADLVETVDALRRDDSALVRTAADWARAEQKTG